jgi:Family of unknown function (DUF5518)
MMEGTGRFWLGVLAGLIIMFAVALITVNLLALLPLAGPFLGGIVAGLIAGKDILNGGKAGFVTGALGAVAISLDFLIRTGYLQGVTVAFRFLSSEIFIVGVTVYLVILGSLGGALGGYLRCGYRQCEAPSPPSP